MKIIIFVEGGGKGKLVGRCKEGFTKLLMKAGFKGKMPRIFPCGARDEAYKTFKKCLFDKDTYPILLVDSEDLLSDPTIKAWDHLKIRDQWDRPDNAHDQQAQLMVTCMETWVIADREALSTYFGSKLNQNQLLSVIDLESRNRKEVLNALEQATKNCQKTYAKGKRSFEVLGVLNPKVLEQNLPHFKSFMSDLNQILENNA